MLRNRHTYRSAIDLLDADLATGDTSVYISPLAMLSAHVPNPCIFEDWLSCRCAVASPVSLETLLTKTMPSLSATRGFATVVMRALRSTWSRRYIGVALLHIVRCAFLGLFDPTPPSSYDGSAWRRRLLTMRLDLEPAIIETLASGRVADTVLVWCVRAYALHVAQCMGGLPVEHVCDLDACSRVVADAMHQLRTWAAHVAPTMPLAHPIEVVATIDDATIQSLAVYRASFRDLCCARRSHAVMARLDASARTSRVVDPRIMQWAAAHPHARPLDAIVQCARSARSTSPLGRFVRDPTTATLKRLAESDPSQYLHVVMLVTAVRRQSVLTVSSLSQATTDRQMAAVVRDQQARYGVRAADDIGADRVRVSECDLVVCMACDRVKTVTTKGVGRKFGYTRCVVDHEGVMRCAGTRTGVDGVACGDAELTRISLLGQCVTFKGVVYVICTGPQCGRVVEYRGEASAWVNPLCEIWCAACISRHAMHSALASSSSLRRIDAATGVVTSLCDVCEVDIGQVRFTIDLVSHHVRSRSDRAYVTPAGCVLCPSCTRLYERHLANRHMSPSVACATLRHIRSARAK